MKKNKKKLSLAVQIVIGLISGVAVGAVFCGNPHVETYLKPLGDIFIRLIEMIVIPIVFSSIIVGVSSIGDIKKLGKIGGKTIIYFEVVTTFAIIIGLIVANIFKPGVGVNISELAKIDMETYVVASESVSHGSILDTIVNIVPNNIFVSLTQGNMLSIILFSILFGLGIATLDKEKSSLLNSFFQGITDVMFWITNNIMKLAPIGVFSLMGMTVSKFGMKSLLPLGKLIILIYGAMILFLVGVLGLVCKIYKINFLQFLKLIKDEITLAFTTASSEAVLPSIMEKMEGYGCPKSIASFVIPTGYSFNLAGSTLYQAIAVIFITQICNIDLTIVQQIKIIVILMLTSKGIAGVPGVSFVVLLATLSAAGIPADGLAFIAGIDRILDMARTAVNIIGNSLAVVVVSKLEGEFDQERAERYVLSLESGELEETDDIEINLDSETAIEQEQAV